MMASRGTGLSPAQRASRLLNSAFSVADGAGTVTAVAPGRVNLIGEHTDYTGGFVLPMAINLACAAALRLHRNGARIRVAVEHKNERAEFNADCELAPGMTLADGHPLRHGDWRSYVVGVVALLAQRCRETGVPVTGFDLAIASDVPIGGGLSSSASLEVSVATAVAAAWGLKLDPRAIAELSRVAEHRFAGVPCGIMDQFISAMGRRGHALLIDCRSLECEHVRMPSDEKAAVVVFNSNVSHSLASGEYARRREACARAASMLGIAELRDATPQMIASSPELAGEPALFRAARHVVTENDRTLAAASAVERGDLPEFGRLMNASHDSLRDDYRVSCDELDTLVSAGRSTRGVIGARMTGGGFGGCVVMLVEPGSVDSVISAVATAYKGRHGVDATAFQVQAADGAMLLNAESTQIHDHR